MNHNEANFEIVGVRFSSPFCFSFIHLYFRVLITELVIGISGNTLILTIKESVDPITFKIEVKRT